MIIDGKEYNVINLLTPDKESQEERAKMLRGTSIGVSVNVIKIEDKWAICWRAGNKMDTDFDNLDKRRREHMLTHQRKGG